jgi:hypothetical protein
MLMSRSRYYQSNTDPPFVYVDRQSSADGAELLAQVISTSAASSGKRVHRRSIGREA